MVGDGQVTSWDVVTASAMGSAHRRAGNPNQDAVLTSRSDAGLVVALADGHGGRTYTRSAVGSRVAVEIGVTLGEELLGATGPLAHAASRLPQEIVTRWRRQVAEHLAGRPFDDEERTVLGSADPVIAYGSTLLLLVARSDECVVLQLGDGDVVVSGQGGAALLPVPHDDRNVAGQTTSLCLADAASSFRMVDLGTTTGIPRISILATDGYGNSFADASWPQAVMADLSSHLDATGPSAIVASLEQWVTESAEVGGDDTTVAIVLATGAATARPRPPAPPLTGAAAAVRASLPPQPPAKSRKQRGAGWTLGLVALALAAGTGIGWAAASLGDDDPTTAAVTTTVVGTTTAPLTTASTSPDTTLPPASTTVPAVNTTAFVPDEPEADGRVVLALYGGRAVELDLLDDDPVIRAADLPYEVPQVTVLALPDTSWRIVSGVLQRLDPRGAWQPVNGTSVPWSLATAAGQVAVGSWDGRTVWLFDASTGALADTITDSTVDRVVPTSTAAPATSRP